MREKMTGDRLWLTWRQLEPQASRVAGRASRSYLAARLGFEVEDLIAEGKILMARMLPRWRPSRGPFQNYFLRGLKFHLRKQLYREAKRRRREVYCDCERIFAAKRLAEAPMPGVAPLSHLLDPICDDLGVKVLLREALGPRLSVRKRAICFGAVFGRTISKSALHRARQRATAAIRKAYPAPGADPKRDG